MFSRLLKYGRNASPGVIRAPGLGAELTLRLATGADAQAVERLAALYGRPIPDGPLLVAEVGGRLQAAITLAGDQELMEPFLPTAALVELLALRARHLREQVTPEGTADAVAQDRCLAGKGTPLLGGSCTAGSS